MLPQNVYEHLKYGNGATPVASLACPDGIHYSLEGGWGKKIVATQYPADFLTNPNAKSKRIRLGDIPTRPESEWSMSWINEA